MCVVSCCYADLRVAFSLFDKDGDGLISVQEVHDTMKSLGFPIELARVKLMVKHVDIDGMSASRLSLLSCFTVRLQRVYGSQENSRNYGLV